MQRIIFMRHAKSDWSQPGQHDKQRSLNERGKLAAPLMGRWLAKQQSAIHRTVISSSVRTRETWELMNPELKNNLVSPKPPQAKPFSSTVQFLDELYLASPNVLWKQVLAFFNDGTVVHAGTDSTLMLLAHNPGMELLVRALSNRDIEFPTAAVAIFERDVNQPVDDLVTSIEQQEWKLAKVQYPKNLAD